MRNVWKNIVCIFIACIIAYLCAVSETNSWYIFGKGPQEDVSNIGCMLIVAIGTFTILRVFIGLLDVEN